MPKKVGNVITYVTTNVTSNVTTIDDLNKTLIENLLPSNGWSILAPFATHDRSFSVNEIKRLFGKSIHINTVRSMIKKLKEKSWIKTYANRTGKTNRETRYIITLEGIAVWKRYIDRNTTQ